LVAQGASPFQPVVILPPVFAFGGDKAFDAPAIAEVGRGFGAGDTMGVERFFEAGAVAKAV